MLVFSIRSGWLSRVSGKVTEGCQPVQYTMVYLIAEEIEGGMIVRYTAEWPMAESKEGR